MLIETLTNFFAGEGGIWALCASAFLSATILPGSSEAILTAALASSAESSRTLLLVAAASLFNTLGSMTSWCIGRFFPDRLPSAPAIERLRRWGAAHELLLCSVDGGGLRNAIPREAAATVAVRKEEFDAFVGEVRAFEAAMRSEFAGIEEEISIVAAACESPKEMIACDVQQSLIRAVTACPDGLQRMSLAMPGLVQTSTNLARVVSDGRTVQLQALLRSSVNSEKEALGDAMSALFELAGAEVELSGSYDGWNPNMDSPILKAMTESYERLYGRRPAVMAIHAGLECGVIGGVYPNLDMISFGPTICYPHSPDEKVEIASVAKFYEFLLHTLKHVPVKA